MGVEESIRASCFPAGREFACIFVPRPPSPVPRPPSPVPRPLQKSASEPRAPGGPRFPLAVAAPLALPSAMPAARFLAADSFIGSWYARPAGSQTE